MAKAELILGAAQLGMAYGVANRRGKMGPDDAHEFLEAAFSAGIRQIDTSPAYGDSEALIGQFLRTNNHSVRLISKLPALGFTSPALARQLLPRVEACLLKSLETLGAEVLDDYLIHVEEDFVLHDAALVEALARCREKGLTRRVGVSVYDPATALRAVELGLDSVQIPCNILDQRFDAAAFFSAAEKSGVRVYARSVFLQGLLLLPVEDVVGWLPAAEQPLRLFHQLAVEHGRSPAELAFVYLRDKRGISSLVIGMESRSQLEANLALMQAPGLGAKALDRIDGLFANVAVSVLNPSLWRRG